ncbi:MAG: L-histidine N(alpha)-methyltransferase [Gammaproteobacteria bacterium]|nr:L-histidine N(alpha)-methyltransferase [Gammaproteobacteria bacterium]MCW8959122.1 L-histidine N(alpha)-methyltransferase [Gammaproteobacteria bacterium]MCW8972176.1 L-histidine N(alpha)-methyltransferase [Gammaproteobacteria bacterium]MCW8991826.1 L-histidine N(alpha)-methyltransferase [Gammaproteobacteria bacterium]
MAIHFYDLHPPTADLKQEVLQGLTRQPRRLSPKLFYDRRGSELFEAITHTPEYYPTRTELGLFERYGSEMAKLLGRDGLLVELGSGSSRKIRLLLDALRPAAYMPVDISRDFLLDAANELAAEFPAIAVHALCADYSRGLELPWCPEELPRAAFFPGSSIGNFEPAEARQLLGHVARALGPGGQLLIGVDLQKDPDVLNAAYNDGEGLTAAFNLNLLARINRELQADFVLDAFHHHAFYNGAEGRMEMHLISAKSQWVEVAGSHFQFATGEGIHTENSYKYTIEGFHKLAAAAGFVPVQVWTDKDDLFSVHCLRVV